MPETHLSYSQLNDWLACRYRWYLKNIEKLRTRKRDTAPSLGSAIHAGIESRLRGQDIETGIQKWFTNSSTFTQYQFTDEDVYQAQQIFDQLASTARLITERAIDFLKLDEWETVTFHGNPLIEFDIETTLPSGEPFVGRVDWVAKNRITGRTWLVDHKTHKHFAQDFVEDVDLQKAIYQYILAKTYGIETTGSLTFQILNHLPKVPSINKDGGVSRRPIHTDWETYRQTVLMSGNLENDYLDMKEKLDNVEFFRLTPSYRSPYEVERYWTQIVQPSAIEIKVERDYYKRNQELHFDPFYDPELEFVRSLNPWTCRPCPMQSICLARLRGDDADFVLESEYSKGE